MSTRRKVNHAISNFAGDLRHLSSQLSDGITFLKRTTDYKPCAGVNEFRGVLEGLEEEVGGLTEDVQILEKFTVDSLSADELLGHCLALYHSNRRKIAELVSHLIQYGYQHPANVVTEPEDPLSLAVHKSCSAEYLSDGEDDRDYLKYDVAVAPTVVKVDKHGRKLPMTPFSASSPTALRSAGPNCRATPSAKAMLHMRVDTDDEDDQGELCGGHPATGSRNAYGTASKRAAGGALLGTATGAHSLFPGSTLTRSRPSMDSHASSTPDGMVMTPGTAALLQKYATASGDSHHMLPISEAPTTVGSTPDSVDLQHTPGELIPFAHLEGHHTDNAPCLQPFPSHDTRPKPTPAHTSHRQQPADDDTCSLYPQVIRSKGLSTSMQQHKAPATPLQPAITPPQSIMPSGLRAQETGVTPNALRRAITPASMRKSFQFGEKDKQLASKLASLENLWVESGQAALTPSRRKLSAGLSPAPPAALQPLPEAHVLKPAVNGSYHTAVQTQSPPQMDAAAMPEPSVSPVRVTRARTGMTPGKKSGVVGASAAREKATLPAETPGKSKKPAQRIATPGKKAPAGSSRFAMSMNMEAERMDLQAADKAHDLAQLTHAQPMPQQPRPDVPAPMTATSSSTSDMSLSKAAAAASSSTAPSAASYKYAPGPVPLLPVPSTTSAGASSLMSHGSYVTPAVDTMSLARMSAQTPATLTMSPGTSQLVARALGGAYVEQMRAQAGPRPSAVPTTTATAPASTPLATAVGTRSHTKRLQAPLDPTTAPHALQCAPQALAAPTVPLPTSIPQPAVATTAQAPAKSLTASASAAGAEMSAPRLCSQVEWQTLANHAQKALPLGVLNQHLLALHTTLIARSSSCPAASALCFVVPDVEMLGLTTSNAKMLINALVKLGRCEVHSAVAGTMQYRLKQAA